MFGSALTLPKEKKRVQYRAIKKNEQKNQETDRERERERWGGKKNRPKNPRADVRHARSFFFVLFFFLLSLPHQPPIAIEFIGFATNLNRLRVTPSTGFQLFFFDVVPLNYSRILLFFFCFNLPPTNLERQSTVELLELEENEGRVWALKCRWFFFYFFIRFALIRFYSNRPGWILIYRHPLLLDCISNRSLIKQLELNRLNLLLIRFQSKV